MIPVDADFKMKVLSRRASRRADISDFFTANDGLAFMNIDLAQVKVSRLKAIGMIDANIITARIGAANTGSGRFTVGTLNVSALNPAYRSIGCGINRWRSTTGNIHTCMNIRS